MIAATVHFVAARSPVTPAGQLARAILSGRRFHANDPALPESPLAWLYRRLGELWDALFRAIAAHVHAGPQLERAVGIFALTAACAVVLAALARLASTGVREAAVAAPRTPARSLTETAPALYARAAGAAAQGELRRAAVLLFHAAVRSMDTSGVARDRAGRTVNEFRRAVRARGPAQLQHFEAIAAPFTAAAYANEPVSLAQWERAAEAYRALEARDA